MSSKRVPWKMQRESVIRNGSDDASANGWFKSDQHGRAIEYRRGKNLVSKSSRRGMQADPDEGEANEG